MAAQGLYFRNEVKSVADMKGIKFRSYNNATSRLAELTGMLPLPLKLLKSARPLRRVLLTQWYLQEQLVMIEKVWESLGYFYEVDAWLPRNYVMVNSMYGQGLLMLTKMLSVVAQLLLNMQVPEVERVHWVYNAGARDGGMTVEKANPTMKGELQEIGATMTAEWLEAAGAEGKAIVDAFKAMK